MCSCGSECRVCASFGSALYIWVRDSPYTDMPFIEEFLSLKYWEMFYAMKILR